MAEYSDEHELLEACRKVRDSGYTRTDAFAPFPVHGIDEALGIKPTILPWIVLCMGLTGLTGATLMEWWMNAVSYPYIISGKPFFSLPAFIPVMFESTILFSAFTAFFSMIFLNGLPRFSNPVFTNPKFDRSTDDRFFLWVDSRDKYFNSDKVKSLLESTSPLGVDPVKEDDSSATVPFFIWKIAAAVILFGLIPGAVILRMRASTSEAPRWHVFFDMDFQPKKKAQQTSTLFADNRASRPPVEGTIARGDLTEADPYYTGIMPKEVALLESTVPARMVSLQDAGAPAQANAATQAGAPAAVEPPWITEIPISAIDDKVMALGEKKFETTCVICHGVAGNGDGLASQRALQLAQGYWVQPTNLHEPRVEGQPVGKIFDTITNGRGKMGGYGPVLSPKERWAIVLYVRALQRSRNASPADLPESQKAKLTATQ